jgi:Tfp pilus assembly protein PilX
MRRTRAKRSGLASVLALIFLALFAILGVAYASMTQSNMLQASNQTHVQTARMQAEGGLSYLSYLINGLSVARAPTEQDLLDAVEAKLRAALDGTVNLNYGTIRRDPNVITVPSIVTDAQGHSFSAQVYVADANSGAVRVRVYGYAGSVSRSVSLDFDLTGGGGNFFDYGVAAQGPISLIGNASIRAKSDPNEAKVLTTVDNDPNKAYNLAGNATLQGDISASDPNAVVSLTGNVSIGGGTVWNGKIYDHIHLGIGPVEFPEIDPTVFEPFATNIVDGSTPTNGNKTFSNIRIKAGTNPTFSGNITLNGVVFVEVPNKVTFSGNLDFTGVLVTQDAGEDTYNQNTIKFAGNTTTRGVEDLPDTPDYHTLRTMPGSFLLAPGFGTEFVGNFGTVNGTMAAEKISLTGNAGGEVKGTVITYSKETFSMVGNSSLTINNPTPSIPPPGFSFRPRIRVNPDSYREY